MSILGAIFANHPTKPCKIYKQSSTIAANGSVTTTYIYDSTVDGIYYVGSSARSLVKESLRASIDGVVLFLPDSVRLQDLENARIDICDIDIGGAVNNSAGYNPGDTTIAIDGFSELKRSIAKYDTFTITSETGTPQHEVVSTTKSGDSTTSIKFTPALAIAILDDAEITLTPVLARLSVIYPDNVAYHDEVVVCPVKAYK